MKYKTRLPSIIASTLFSAAAAASEDISICKAGWAETESGHHEKALKLFQECIEKGELSEQSLARTYRNIGIAYRRNGQAHLAIPFYDKSLALNPSDPWNDYVNKGNAYSEYELAEKANPTEGEIPYNRGIVFERQEKLVLAAAEFQKAYELGLRTKLLYERMVVHKMIEPAK
jgi:tetratricopeptide (TPR) repeat protein